MSICTVIFPTLQEKNKFTDFLIRQTDFKVGFIGGMYKAVHDKAPIISFSASPDQVSKIRLWAQDDDLDMKYWVYYRTPYNT